MLKCVRCLCAAATIFSVLIFAFCIYAENSLPDEFYVSKGDCFDEFSRFDLKVKTQNTGSVLTADTSDEKNTKTVELKLFGIIPVKTAEVTEVDPVEVTPCGIPFGVKLFTKGVMVVGMTEVDGVSGMINPAENAGVKEGDIIISINGQNVSTNNEVASIIEKSRGNAVEMLIIRNGEQLTVDFMPVMSASSKTYKAGIWVRDSSAGIGTLSFYNADTGVFGGLGHGICDVDTGELLPLESGEIISTEITDVIIGKKGYPGELCGYFNESDILGELLTNTNVGIYGRLKRFPVENAPVEAAMKQDINTGKAEIITTVDSGVPKKYEIEIERVYYNSDSVQKNMVIKVTDPELLEKTGGIVQGMSGSPIIQDGKFIGAVTHVFVNDTTKGYAIFAENMLYAADALLDNDVKLAS